MEAAKPPTCLNCNYWSMWDGSCAARAMALDDFSPIDPDTPACKEFESICGMLEKGIHSTKGDKA